MISFPDINPVLIPIGPLAISWYSLSYVVGILIGLRYCKQLVVLLNKKQSEYQITKEQVIKEQITKKQITKGQVTKEHLEYFVNWAIIGIIAGGRLGYVLFYDPAKYFAHPTQILKTYEGGMSFHGGLIGYCLAALLFARKWQISFLALTDLSAMAAPIPICLARIANFINGELYGRITSVPWAVIFPNSDLEPRHPSQIYEAILEGLILFLLLLFIGIKWQFLQKRGAITGLFLIFYSLMRIFVECFREPDSQIGFLLGSFTMGQILSSLMLGAGIGLAVYNRIFITRNKLPVKCP